MAAPSKLWARITASRKSLLVAFAISLGTLLLAAVWFTAARQALGDAYLQAGAAEQQLAEARQRLQETELRVRLAENATALVAQAKADGLVESRWGERLINVAQAPLPRADVNHLLASIARDETRIFGAETFELSVTRPDEGLFDATDPRSPPLLMTMRGTLLFRTEDLP